MDKQVARILNVSDSLMMDCYYIASLARPTTAMNIYSSMQYNVNTRGDIMFACMRGNYVLGFVSGHRMKDDKWYVDWLFVDKRHQRCGVGRQLMDAYENHVTVNGGGEIMLHSAPNGNAPMFYKNRGYVLGGANYMMRKQIVR